MDEKTLDNIPFDIVIEILQYLSYEDLVLSMQNVSRHWHNMIQDSVLWREISFKPPFGLKTENVVSLLEQSPLLRSFEFRVGLKQSEIFDALCEHNPNIISLAFDTYETNSNIIRKLVAKFPDLQYLQLPLAVFVNHIPYLRKLQNLKKVKCIQHFNENFPIGHGELVDEETDWCSLESLELSSDHTQNNFDNMMTRVRAQLISLEMQTVHTSRFLEHIQHSVKLEKLKVNFASRQMSDSDIDAFFISLKNLINLKYLSISSFVHADANVLSKVFRKNKFSNLVELKFNHCLNFSSLVAKDIADACPKLESIHLNGCLVLDDSSLRELSRCVHLCVVAIPGSLSVTELGLSYLASCLKLSKLNISWIGLLSAPILEQIAKMKRLTVLDIDHTEVDSTHLIDTVKQLTHLKLLSVYCTSGVDGLELQKILPRCYVRHVKKNFYGIMKEKASTLRKLQINGVTQSVLKVLPDCKNLEDLSINFVHYPCHTFPEVFSGIKRFGKLKKLSLKAFATTEDIVLGEMLSGEGLSQLRELNLENCLSVNQEVAVLIADHNPQLEKFRLPGCLALNDDGLYAIVKIENLRHLDISGCTSITETGLFFLEKCKSLTDLNICGILHEDVASDVLNSILTLPELGHLHLDNNELIVNFLESRKWVRDVKFHEGRYVTYMPSETAPLS